MRDDFLEQIGEEEENEIVVFGGSSAHRETKMPHSISDTSLSSASGSDLSRSRGRAKKNPPRAPSAASNGSQRRIKTCVKCGETVGGSKRFVERDGIILCEKDWKKLYLPSCRRCSRPIEKSAVSSSDGQLKGKWHRACFTCTKCDQPFEGDSFYVHEGKPWCQYHYHEVT